MSSAHNNKYPGNLEDVVSGFAATKSTDIIDTEFGMGVEDTEVLRRELATKYRAEVHTPRLESWKVFDTFVKAGEPTWVNPLIMQPKKPKGLGNEARQNQYSNVLSVARWDFEHTSPDQQVKTTLAVHGFQAFDDHAWRDLGKEFPTLHPGTFLLGRNRTIRDNYLADRIQAINGYTINVTIDNLEGDDRKEIFFRGQDDFDTFVTLPELQETGRSYSEYRESCRGKEYRTRSANFQGLFTAPIETPTELDRDFMVIHGADGINIGSTIQAYAYLFKQTPRVRFYGEVAITDGNDLFEYRGDETLAYMQAAALFDFMQGALLVQPQ